MGDVNFEDEYVWIRTQDGSPTLWSNQLGEPFRSVKGAFRESLLVFVKPAIEYIQKRKIDRPIIGEFGLGTGTNWLLFNIAASAFEIEHTYFAIEKNPVPFFEAQKKWQNEMPLIEKLVLDIFQKKISLSTFNFQQPKIFSSLEKTSCEFKANIWFHDPFGFSVNPEGYSEETILKCHNLWAPEFLGLSYACNSNFQKVLKNQNISRVESIDTLSPPLKKERLEFERLTQS
jgi:tRNA U34 5-methylaminomethyl-2-thiouridine-forming methyltransferase MnmC